VKIGLRLSRFTSGARDRINYVYKKLYNEVKNYQRFVTFLLIKRGIYKFKSLTTAISREFPDKLLVELLTYSLLPPFEYEATLLKETLDVNFYLKIKNHIH